MSKITGKQLAEDFSDLVNNYNTEEQDEFLKYFARQHRTLQQSMFRLMMKTVDVCAQPDYGRDGRNEGTHQLAKQLIEGFKLVIGKEFAKNHHSGKLEDYDKKYIASDNCIPSNCLGSV